MGTKQTLFQTQQSSLALGIAPEIQESSWLTKPLTITRQITFLKDLSIQMCLKVMANNLSTQCTQQKPTHMDQSLLQFTRCLLASMRDLKDLLGTLQNVECPGILDSTHPVTNITLIKKANEMRFFQYSMFIPCTTFKFVFFAF